MATRQALERLRRAESPLYPSTGGAPLVFVNFENAADRAANDVLSTLLANIIKAMKLDHSEVRILVGEPEGGWASWLQTTEPKLIVCLGPEALTLTGLTVAEPGQWMDLHGTPVIATLPLTQIQTTGASTMKRQLWEHMLEVLRRLDKPITSAQRNYFK